MATQTEELITELTEDEIYAIRSRYKRPLNVKVPGQKPLLEEVYDFLESLYKEGKLTEHPFPVKTIIGQFKRKRPSIETALRKLKEVKIIEPAGHGFIRKGPTLFSKELIEDKRRTGITGNIRAYLIAHGFYAGRLIPVPKLIRDFDGRYSRHKIYQTLKNLHKDRFVANVHWNFLGFPLYNFRSKSNHILSIRQHEILYLLTYLGSLSIGEISQIISNSEDKKLSNHHIKAFILDRLLKLGYVSREDDAYRATATGIEVYNVMANLSPLLFEMFEEKYFESIRQRFLDNFPENNRELLASYFDKINGTKKAVISNRLVYIADEFKRVLGYIPGKFYNDLLRFGPSNPNLERYLDGVKRDLENIEYQMKFRRKN